MPQTAGSTFPELVRSKTELSIMLEELLEEEALAGLCGYDLSLMT